MGTRSLGLLDGPEEEVVGGVLPALQVAGGGGGKVLVAVPPGDHQGPAPGPRAPRPRPAPRPWPPGGRRQGGHLHRREEAHVARVAVGVACRGQVQDGKEGDKIFMCFKIYFVKVFYVRCNFRTKCSVSYFF